MTSSSSSFVRTTKYGVVVARPIEALSKDRALATLHADEAALAATWGELRVRTFSAGRLALRDALAAAGLQVRAAYGDFSGTPLGLEHERMVIVADLP